MKLLSTLILTAFVASAQSAKYADVKYDMVATSKSSKSRSISSSKSSKSSYFHDELADELATQYIRVRAGKVRRIFCMSLCLSSYPIFIALYHYLMYHYLMYPLSVYMSCTNITCILF